MDQWLLPFASFATGFWRPDPPGFSIAQNLAKTAPDDLSGAVFSFLEPGVTPVSSSPFDLNVTLNPIPSLPQSSTLWLRLGEGLGVVLVQVFTGDEEWGSWFLSIGNALETHILSHPKLLPPGEEITVVVRPLAGMKSLRVTWLAIRQAEGDPSRFEESPYHLDQGGRGRFNPQGEGSFLQPRHPESPPPKTWPWGASHDFFRPSRLREDGDNSP